MSLQVELEDGAGDYACVVPRVGTPHIHAAVVGLCIYCRSQSSRLTDEHIIPDAMGGHILLDQASCDECSRIINKWEAHYINAGLRYLRGHLDLRSRRKSRNRASKRKPHTFEIGRGLDPTEATPVIEVDAYAGMPYIVFYPIFLERPRLLTGHDLSAKPECTVRISYPRDIGTKVDSLGIGSQTFLRARLSMPHFFKMLAKICHAFTVAAIGIDSFRPYLTDLIRNIDPIIDTQHMGCIEHFIDPNDDYLHWLALKVSKVYFRMESGLIVSKELCIVHARLFPGFNSPLYEVVVGERCRPPE